MDFLKKLFDALFMPKTLPSAMRRAGYAGDQMGIRNRYLREKANWQSHLDNTKQYILESARNAERHGSVAVLGSGWLYDVPVEDLSQAFADVYLVDIVHPEPVKVRVGRMPNVHLLTCDLTGGAVQMATQAVSFADFSEKFASARLDIQLGDYDFVVSVNLLNQLDIILCDYLKKRFKIGEERLQQVRVAVQQRHVDALPKGRSCLITDYLQVDSPVDGSAENGIPLVYCHLPENMTFKEWKWIFDTNQRYSVKNNTTFKVKAVCF